MKSHRCQPILVTGASGLVGRALCQHLSDDGLSLLPVVRQQPRSAPVRDALALDVASEPLVEGVKLPVGAIVHLAAAVPHATHYPDTPRSSSLTRAMDENVYAAAQHWQCPVVYLSTCGLYDRQSPDVKVEQLADIKPTSPYFDAKYAGEQLLAQLPATTVLRLSAPVGPGLKSGLVFSRFIETARSNGTIEVWGTGAREQNFIDVRDLVRLIISALQHPTPGIFNAAAAHPVTMKALADQVVRTLGKGQVKMADKPDPKDSETARYSIEKAQRCFGWHPQITLQDSIRWMSDKHFE